MFYARGVPISRITSRLKEGTQHRVHLRPHIASLTAYTGGAFVFFPTVEMTNKAVDVVHHFKYEGRWLDAFLVKVRA